MTPRHPPGNSTAAATEHRDSAGTGRAATAPVRPGRQQLPSNPPGPLRSSERPLIRTAAPRVRGDADAGFGSTQRCCSLPYERRSGSRRASHSVRTTTSGCGERGGLLHRRSGPPTDARRRGRHPGRDVAPRGEAAAVAGVRSALLASTVVPRASGRTPRLSEATVRGHGPAPMSHQGQQGGPRPRHARA